MEPTTQLEWEDVPTDWAIQYMLFTIYFIRNKFSLSFNI